MARKTSRTATVRSFRTRIGIPPADRTRLVALLNANLADAFDLVSQTKQAHWNVKGSDFWQLHKLFDEIAEAAEDWVDEIAERITALGGYANGTARMAAAASRLPEFPTDITDSMDFVAALADRVAAFSNAARDAIDEADEKLGDADTADLFTEISRDADKYLYFLEAHLQDRR